MINMRSRDKTLIAVIAFVALIAAVGFVTFNRFNTKKELEQAQTEKIEEKQEEKQEDKIEEVQSANTNNVEAEIEKEVEPEPEIQEPVETSEPKEELTFSKGEQLIWPIDGNVILNYSMDQTVYFATLDQYKYNPALVISGELGEPVLAAADGKVKSLNSDARTGNMIVMDIGNGYELVYGQLQEVRVVEGEIIKQGDVIAYIEEPTKYYTVEGPNLYFQMLKDGNPENPLEYMGE